MSKEIILWCIVMYICGQLFHLFVNKIPALRKRAKAANYEFSLADYWKEEWNMIAAAVVFGIMLIVGLGELVKWKPETQEIIRWVCGFVGYFFNSLIVGKLGQYEKKLSNLIDLKTNVADQVMATNVKGKPVEMKTSAPGEK